MKKFSLKRIPIRIVIELALIAIVIAGIGAYWVHRQVVNNNAAPVITIDENSNSFSVKADEDELFKGVSATDKEDGNVSDDMIIESISQLFDGNKRTVTYVAFDSSNHVVKLDRDITYTDYVSPQFTSPKEISVPTGRSTEILAKLTATDCIDGDISDQIKLEVNNVTPGLPGQYPVKISVTNSCGDVSTRDIVVTVTGEEE